MIHIPENLIMDYYKKGHTKEWIASIICNIKTKQCFRENNDFQPEITKKDAVKIVENCILKYNNKEVE